MLKLYKSYRKKVESQVESQNNFARRKAIGRYFNLAPVLCIDYPVNMYIVWCILEEDNLINICLYKLSYNF